MKSFIQQAYVCAATHKPVCTHSPAERDKKQRRNEVAMNVIITAGGTRERIDSVRAITNDATGRLGSLIAETFSLRLAKEEDRIYYVCGMGAVLPKTEDRRLQIIRIEGTDQLQNQIKHLLTSKKIDAIIHSMAVSDYWVNNVTTLEEVSQVLYQKKAELSDTAAYEDWKRVILEAMNGQAVKRQQKISSNLENPLLVLERTPKVIGIMKKTSPQTLLVGFKLLSGVEKEQLIDTAYELLLKNSCDFVLANDTRTIKEEEHIGYLVDKDKSYKTFTTKKQIAEGIADCVLDSIG